MARTPFAQLADTPIADTLPEWAHKLPAEQQRAMIETALHESAHVLAAFAVGAKVEEVEIRPRPLRGQVGGRSGSAKLAIQILEREQEAFVLAAGVAWEELHGAPQLHAVSDEHKGIAATIYVGHWPHILGCARTYVRDHDKEIRECAAILLSRLSASRYRVPPGTLEKLFHWFRFAIGRMPLATLQAVPHQGPVTPTLSPPKPRPKPRPKPKNVPKPKVVRPLPLPPPPAPEPTRIAAALSADLLAAADAPLKPPPPPNPLQFGYTGPAEALHVYVSDDDLRDLPLPTRMKYAHLFMQKR